MSRVPESELPSQTSSTPDIPHTLTVQLQSITTTLRTYFSERPPHTIQRLAELVLAPTKHYRTLPAWLRAVDRVVSVSSSADIFPLPTAQPLPPSMVDTIMVNGVSPNSNGTDSSTGSNGSSLSSFGWAHDNLGSDESLGGALLTPIPWLRNGDATALSSPPPTTMAGSERIDVEADMVPSRDDGAVTQGELIRMEQERGIVPMSQGTHRMESARPVDEDGSGEDAVPHATGPDVVGVQDMGLQDGQDVELQLGRKPPEEEQSESVETGSEGLSEQKAGGEGGGEGGDVDGDVVLTDADGKTEQDEKADASGENEGPDAADTTAR
ncbi:MAG: hypothetical protein Q9160_006820 [Pyrenula sp. 1 TL-2023]